MLTKTKPRKIKAKRYDRKLRTLFKDWGLNSADQLLERIAAKLLAEAFEIATSYKAIAWIESQQRAADPTMIAIELPLGESEFEGPVWHVSLDALVQHEITVALDDSDHTHQIAPHAAQDVIRLRESLRLLIGMIDRHLLPQHHCFDRAEQ